MVLGLTLGLVLGLGERAEAAPFGMPKVVTTLRDNYRAGRFYATDLTPHPSARAALIRSLHPLDLKQNLRSVLRTRLHPVKLVTGIWAPVSLVAQRALADGRIPGASELTSVLKPGTLIATQAAALGGDLAGATMHSLLARMGPVGAAAGLVLRPLLAQSAQIAGLNLGRGLDRHLSVRAALAQGLRDIRPLRELGNVAGYAAGMIAGQVLIPIPVIGALIGSAAGATLGTFMGTWLAKSKTGGALDRWMTEALARWADRLDPPRAVTETAAPVVATAASAVDVPTTTVAASRGGAPDAPDGPDFADLPVARR